MSINYNGHPSNVTRKVKRFIKRARKFGLYVTSTTDGSSHTPSSHHYPRNNPDGLGHAVDLAGTRANMERYQRHITRSARHCRRFKEVFGPINNRCVKNGTMITLSDGSGLENSHDNHIHIAV